MSTAHPEIETRRQARIHIDEHPYESPNPTTGEALYALSKVPVGLELYRELRGDREDATVPAGPEVVHLTEDEHFHSGPPQVKEFEIFVNGRKKVVPEQQLSFDQVLGLAFNPVPTGPSIMFTITYRNGPRANREGNLLEGGTVKLKNRMILNVTATNKS
jgi:hypothetical protein